MSLNTAGNLSADLTQVIQIINEHNENRGDFQVTGTIPWESSLGIVIRLHWVSFTNACRPDCWELHCPDPDTHVRKFRVTSEGAEVARRLTDKRVTRTGVWG
jgi:hypothetical protein